MKKFVVWGLFIALIVSAGLVFAGKPDFQAATITNPETGELKNTVTLPPKAIEVAPNIVYLGTAIDEGRAVEGYAIIDYKDGFGKPTGCNNDGVCQGWEAASCADCAGNTLNTSSCYGFLAKGTKWKTIEPYMVNPSNTVGLNESFVMSNLALDIAKWETAAGTNILGNNVSGVVDGADTIKPDNKNEVYFANIAQEGAIAITIVWGIFKGPPSQRELVEWDQVYDQTDFDWSAAGETGKMDFENIATHELGHSVGLADLYDSFCSEQTMYGYADYGETKKRTLEAGDTKGAKELYS